MPTDRQTDRQTGGLVNYLAFTLAEVIIVLGIIGIIAQNTIPTLINTTKEQEYFVALKKIYSNLSQVQKLIGLESSGNYSDATSSCGNVVGATAGATCLKNAWKPFFRISKDCDSPNAFGVGNCFIDEASIRFYSVNMEIWDHYLDQNVRAGFTTVDGMSLIFYNISGSCTGTYGDPTFANKVCGLVTADINGFKRPNQWGKDIYAFFIYSDRIAPLSPAEATSGVDDCVSGGKGWTCAYKYILNNKITD